MSAQRGPSAADFTECVYATNVNVSHRFVPLIKPNQFKLKLNVSVLRDHSSNRPEKERCTCLIYSISNGTTTLTK